MKLWVDDVRDAPDDSWTVVRKVQPAINFLFLFGAKVTEISLDHDIENRPDDETFMPIAYYIAGAADTFKILDKIYIHSINPVGANHMQYILHQAGWTAIRKPYAPDMDRMEKEYGIKRLPDEE